MALVVVAGLFWGCADGESGDEGPGAPCGEVNCSGTEYCCDAACGLCVDEGVACTETCGP
jgi:hypothetical protein